MTLSGNININLTGFDDLNAPWSERERLVWRPPEAMTVSEHADRHRMLSATAETEPGQWHTDRAGLDTGGGVSASGDWSCTEEVYEWLRSVPRGRVFGIKGSSRPLSGIRVKHSVIDKLPSGRKIPGGLTLWFVDSAQFKDLFHWRMENAQNNASTPQQAHLHSEVAEDYAKEILGEEKRRDPRTGKEAWFAIGANHFLDCECYASAVADPQFMGGVKILGPAEATGSPIILSNPPPEAVGSAARGVDVTQPGGNAGEWMAGLKNNWL